MMHDKRALGKGLSALLSETSGSVDNAVVHNSENTIGQITNIPIKYIRFNPNQPRKHINPEDIEELAGSIQEFGILQPILVKQTDVSEYQIIAGERRYHAAKKAGLIEIPVIIKTVNETIAFEIAVIENIQRQNLTPLEEAEAYRKLLDEYSHTQESLAKKIGKSRSFIANTVRLLRLPDEVKQLILDGKLSAGHARTMVNSDNPLELARTIIANNLTVRETEALLKRIENSNIKAATTKLEKENSVELIDKENIQQIEDMLYQTLHIPVKIQVKHNKFTIMIKCPNTEQLDKVISKLSDDLANN